MASRTKDRKTWADRHSIPTGIWQERWEGIHILEVNRATVFEFRPEGIQELITLCHNNYKRKGINAVVFGVDEGGDAEIKYAVFVQSGFLREVPEDEDLTPRKRKKRHGRTR